MIINRVICLNDGSQVCLHHLMESNELVCMPHEISHHLEVQVKIPGQRPVSLRITMSSMFFDNQ